MAIIDSNNTIKSVMKKDAQIIEINSNITYDQVTDLKNLIRMELKDCIGYVFNISRVNQIDSTGLGMLVTIAKEQLSKRRKIIIVTKDSFIIELFEISKLDKIFLIVGSEDEGIKALTEISEDYFENIKKY